MPNTHLFVLPLTVGKKGLLFHVALTMRQSSGSTSRRISALGMPPENETVSVDV